MHMASKHESHQAFIGEALAHFGGVVPSPSKLLAFRRKAAEAAAQEGGGAGMQGGGGAPGSGGAGGGNGAAQQPGIDGNEGGAAMGKNGNSAAGSPAQTAGPGSGGPVHGAAGLGGGPGAGPGGGVGNGSMPVPQQPPPQQPMQAREAVPPGSYAVPAHAVHQHVHPHQVCFAAFLRSCVGCCQSTFRIDPHFATEPYASQKCAPTLQVETVLWC